MTDVIERAIDSLVEVSSDLRSLDDVVKGTWKQNPDGTVDVDGYVDLGRKGLQKLPFKFGKVSGDFFCIHNHLSSLQGAPSSVGGSFYCYNNHLSSLQGAPRTVGGYFHCENNQLTSLQGAPSRVGSSFFCTNNRLTTLKGAPSSVGGDFYCNNNQLTSLQGAPPRSSIDGEVIFRPGNKDLRDAEIKRWKNT